MVLLKFQLNFVLFFYGLLTLKTLAQEPSATIELSETTIPIERPFTISVILRNTETRPTIVFPTIKGLIKKGTYTSITPVEIDGKTIVSQVIRQTYTAVRPGEYRLPAFSLAVGETTVASPGAVLTFQASTETPTEAPPPVLTDKATEKNAAFLSLSTSHKSVYTGEGFSLKLSFFVAESYPFELSFYKLEPQLQQILKTLRPANCWEENAGIQEVEPHPVTIHGKPFTEYRIYQATFFPLNKQPVRLPSVSLQMNQERPAPVAGGPRIKELVTFSTRPLAITVNPLPPHPLRDQVAVGQYRLVESVSRLTPSAGQSVQYAFRIVGEGNIASLSAPTIPDTTKFDVLPPDAKERIDRSGTLVRGEKAFRYAIIPRQNGNFPLRSLFQWIYFDPKRTVYDTLRSAITLRVGGVALPEGDTTQIGLPGSIYTGIEQLDSSQQPINVQGVIRWAVNLLLIVMIVGMMYLFWRK